MLIAKVLFDGLNYSKDKNRRRCFQGYQRHGVSQESSRIIVFHQICQQNIGDMFLPVWRLQDCMKIQSDLNKLSEWCERNSLFLNVDKCKTITFSKTCYAYMLAGTVLDQVSSITDLGVIIFRFVRLLRCWILSEDCHSSSDPYTLRSVRTCRDLHVFGSSEAGAHSITYVWTRLNVCR
jgi:hypothetical protein